MSFRKGDVVKLNEATCFTRDNHEKGEREFPLSSWHNDDAGIVYAQRAPTEPELEAWENSPASKGLDSAGETKLPPRAVNMALYKGRQYTVLRGRARKTCVWGNPLGGYVLIEVEPGQPGVFIRREHLRHA